jgi:hypothetical protein
MLILVAFSAITSLVCFSSYEEDFLALTGDVLKSLSCVVNLHDGLVEVNDVNAVALGVNVRSHSGAPLALQVAKVAAGLQQLVKICSCHCLLFNFSCLLSF